jgi:hypothetical protein
MLRVPVEVHNTFTGPKGGLESTTASKDISRGFIRILMACLHHSTKADPQTEKTTAFVSFICPAQSSLQAGLLTKDLDGKLKISV